MNVTMVKQLLNNSSPGVPVNNTKTNDVRVAIGNFLHFILIISVPYALTLVIK